MTVPATASKWMLTIMAYLISSDTGAACQPNYSEINLPFAATALAAECQLRSARVLLVLFCESEVSSDLIRHRDLPVCSTRLSHVSISRRVGLTLPGWADVTERQAAELYKHLLGFSPSPNIWSDTIDQWITGSWESSSTHCRLLERKKKKKSTSHFFRP